MTGKYLRVQMTGLLHLCMEWLWTSGTMNRKFYCLGRIRGILQSGIQMSCKWRRREGVRCIRSNSSRSYPTKMVCSMLFYPILLQAPPFDLNWCKSDLCGQNFISLLLLNIISFCWFLLKCEESARSFTAYSPCLGHDRQKIARIDDRLVALVYWMTADFRYNEQKVLVFGKDQGYITNRHTNVLQVKAPWRCTLYQDELCQELPHLN